MQTMKKIYLTLLLATAASLAQPALAAGPQGVSVTPLMAKDLPDFPGKEGLMITVDYAPGAADPVHRHRAHAFVYVLEGSIVMGVKGGKEVTLTAGQTFYEGPNDIHTVGRNASTTQPAKFLVLLLKKKKAEVLELVK
jgi:quercetin dioxygenase-like cupin family protein